MDSLLLIVKTRLSFLSQLRKVCLLKLIFIGCSYNATSQQWVAYNSVNSTGTVSPSYSAIDSANNTYSYGKFTGTFQSPLGDIIANGTGEDLILVKFDENGQVLWNTRIGSTTPFHNIPDLDGGMCLDDTGNVYIAGSFFGFGGFDGGPTLTGTQYDMFLAKYDTDGVLLWNKVIGTGTSTQLSLDIKMNEDQEIIMCGAYSGQLIIGSDVDRDTLSGGTYMDFIATLNSDGELINVVDFEATNQVSRLQRVVVSTNGYYFGGTFQGTLNLDVDTITSLSSSKDNFIYKTDRNLNGQWIRKIQGSNVENFQQITTDKNNSVYLLGNYTSPSVSIDSTEFASTSIPINNGGFDTYILKYNKSGSLTWKFQLGGIRDDWYNDIDINGDIIYTTGYFTDQVIFNQDTLVTEVDTLGDVFLAAFNNNGDAIAGINIQATGHHLDAGTSIQSDSNLYAYLVGYLNSDTIVQGDSLLIDSNLGGRNLFFARYSHPFKATVSQEQNVSCNGLSDGMFTVTPYFGVPPYTYDWSHDVGLNDSTATGLAAGTYTVEITDFRDSITQVVKIISEPADLSLDLDSTNTLCYNGNDGSINLTVSGGEAPYSYQWTGGTGVNPSTEDQSGLVSGWYFVTVTDAFDCQSSDSVIVDEPDKIIFNGSVVTDNSIIDTGAVNLTVSGGNPAYTYSWTGTNSFVSTDEDIDSLPGGDYNITVTDNNLCERDTSFVVGDDNSLVIYINSVSHVTCRGDADGSASVTITNGTGPYQYSWENSIGTEISTISTISNQPGGWYWITITDQNGGDYRYATDSILIIEASLDLTVDKFVANPTCFGDSDGLVDIQVSGGISNYSYLWSNGRTTEDLVGLGYTGDTLYLTVSDAHGCTGNNWVYIVNPPELTVDITLSQPVQCIGSLSGELLAATSGGNSPLSYQWDDDGSQTEQLATELGAGNYSVLVTDNSGCQNSDTFSISDPIIMALDTIYGYDGDCYGSGAMAAYVSGGSSNYSYNWGHTIVDSDSLSDLFSGSYTLTVTDITCGYIDSGSVTLSQPDNLSISNIDSTDVSCNSDSNGQIIITPAGGGTGVIYRYEWSHDAGLNNATASSLPAGNYTVSVYDDVCNDTIIENIIIEEPLALSISNIDSNDVSCNSDSDGQIIVTPAGGSVGVTYRYEWSHDAGLNNATAGTLSGGNYTVTLYDDACSDSVVDNIIIEEPLALSFSDIDSTDVSCNGDSDGQIIVTPAGGSVGVTYRYEWSHDGGLNNATASSLSPGPYTVTLYDDACSDNVADNIIIEEPLALSINNIDSTDVSCNGDGDGQIIVTPGGGSVGVTYRYEWSHDGGLNNATASSLSPGPYTVTLYDDACSDNVTDNIIIEEPLALSISNIDSTDVSCNGDSDGQIIVTPAGGSVGVTYRYEWSHDVGLDNATASALPAGNYTVTLYDDACSDNVTDNIIIEEPVALSISNIDSTDVSCNGDSDGQIIVTPAGGSVGVTYRYEWSHDVGLNNATASTLPAGNYTVTLYDDACSDNVTDNIIIEEPLALSISDIDSTDVSCNGDSDGQIIVTPAGGSVGVTYRYAWSHDGGLNNATASSLSPGPYTVTLYDDACSDNIADNIIIEEPLALSISNIDSTDVSCNGDSDGQIIVTPAGGSAGVTYRYEWSHDVGLDNATASALPAGNYTVTLYDDACSDYVADNIIIEEPLALSISNIDSTDVSCNGDSDGQIIVTPAGGSVGVTYRYEWSHDGGLNNATASALPAGNYTVTLYDDACSDNVADNIIIEEPLALSISDIDSTDVSCNGDSDGQIIVTPAGGSVGVTYRYVWSHDGGLNNATASSLSPGPYTVTLYDDACSDNIADNIIIEEPLALSISDIDSTDVSCNGDSDGQIIVTPAGGSAGVTYRYEWSHDAGLDNATASTLPAGNYTVTLYDDACSDNVADNIIIEEPLALSISNIDSTDVSCNGDSDGQIIVTPAGGSAGVTYRYEWSHDAGLNNATASTLPAGNYTVTLYDDACSDNVADNIIIEEPLALSISDIDSTDVSCNGDSDGQIIVTPAGGSAGVTYRYEWSHDAGLNNATASTLPAGNYTVTLYDDACSDNVADNIIIEEPLALSISDIDSTDVSCNGDGDGQIIVTPAGGSAGVTYRYEWSHDVGLNNATASTLPAGNYTVTLYDDACSDNVAENIIIEEPLALSISDIDSTDISCNGDSDGQIIVTPAGGSAGVIYRYEWSHDAGLNNATASTLPAGNYTVTLYDDACSDNVADNIIIEEPLALSISDIDSTDVSCNGDGDGQIIVTPAGGSAGVTYRYEWSHDAGLNNATASVLPAGNYTVTLYDDACSDNVADNIIIEEPLALSISDIDSTDVSCNGDSDGQIIVTPAGGSVGVTYRYEWSHDGGLNNATASTLPAGSYTVTLYDDACSDNVADNIIIEEPLALSISNIDSTDVSCNGDSDGQIMVTPAGGSAGVTYRYEWSHDAGLNNATASSLPAGSYNVTVFDDACLESINSNNININEPAVLNLTIEQQTNLDCNNEAIGAITVDSEGGSGSYRYEWSHNTELVDKNANNLLAGSYEITVHDDACSQFDTKTIEILQPDSIIIDSVSVTDVLNPGDGEIIVYATGGTGQLQFAINGSAFVNENFFSGLNTGNYDVQITDANGCGPISYNNVQIATDIIKVNSMVNVSIYPNPASEYVTIELENEAMKDNEIVVMNSLGQKVWSGIMSQGDKKLIIEADEFSNGYYFLLFNKKKITQPIIIEKF